MYTTKEICELSGYSYTIIYALINGGYIERPPKVRRKYNGGVGGAAVGLVWSEDYIKKIQEAAERRRLHRANSTGKKTAAKVPIAKTGYELAMNAFNRAMRR